MPIILGVLKLPPYFVLLENCVVIDPLERIVHLNPNDVVKSHTILLPSASRVVHALRPSAEIILRYSRKQKASRYKKLAVNQSFLIRSIAPNNDTLSNSVASMIFPSATVSNVSAAYVKGTAESGGELPSPTPTLKNEDIKSLKLNIPLELSINSSDCSEFLGEVKKFSGIVSNHILAIVNTAIQLQIEEKSEARKKRRIVNPSKSAKLSSQLSQGLTSIALSPMSIAPPVTEKHDEAVKTLVASSPVNQVPTFSRQLNTGSALSANGPGSNPVSSITGEKHDTTSPPPVQSIVMGNKMDVSELSESPIDEIFRSRSPKERTSLLSTISSSPKSKKSQTSQPPPSVAIRDRKKKPRQILTKISEHDVNNPLGSPSSINTQPTPRINPIGKHGRQSISPVHGPRQSCGHTGGRGGNRVRPQSLPRDFNLSKVNLAKLAEKQADSTSSKYDPALAMPN
ncbi:hypothetical protein EON65_07105, partial [archaeon]